MFHAHLRSMCILLFQEGMSTRKLHVFYFLENFLSNGGGGPLVFTFGIEVFHIFY